MDPEWVGVIGGLVLSALTLGLDVWWKRKTLTSRNRDESEHREGRPPRAAA